MGRREDMEGRKYKYELLLKSARKVGAKPKGIEMPSSPVWNPDHIQSAKDWIGRSPILEPYINTYLGLKK
jgi:hypothetical protein